MCFDCCHSSKASRYSRLTSARVWRTTPSACSVLAAMARVVVVEVPVDVALDVLELEVPAERVADRRPHLRCDQRVERPGVCRDHAVPARVVVRKRAALAHGDEGADALDAA